MKKIDLALLVITIIILILIVMTIIYIKSEGGKCILNPLGYSQSKLSENAFCSCTEHVGPKTITYYANRNLTPS